MTEKTSNRLTLTIEGSSVDDGHVRLADLIDELEALKEALRQTERSMYNNQRAEVYYRIIDASHSSPLRMVLEPVPTLPARQSNKRASAVVKTFTGSISQLHRHRRPANIDVPALESYKELGATLGRHVERISITYDRNKVIPIDRAFQEKVADVIGPDEVSIGSISGRLERLNVHNAFRFEIFPTVGPRRVQCTFKEGELQKVLGAVTRYVTVTGRLRYKQWSPFPYAIDMKSLDQHEMEEDLPTLDSIRGISPGATGDLSSEDFVRRMRDEEW